MQVCPLYITLYLQSRKFDLKARCNDRKGTIKRFAKRTISPHDLSSQQTSDKTITFLLIICLTGLGYKLHAHTFLYGHYWVSITHMGQCTITSFYVLFFLLCPINVNMWHYYKYFIARVFAWVCAVSVSEKAWSHNHFKGLRTWDLCLLYNLMPWRQLKEPTVSCHWHSQGSEPLERACSLSSQLMICIDLFWGALFIIY